MANLKVVRRSEPDTLSFRVIRDDIPVHTVDAKYMADPTTGYIRISSFGAETPQEFIDAYNDLLDKGMKNLIIDLQDNGGGYLSASVDIAKHFLPSGSTIVYTEGLRQEPPVLLCRQPQTGPDSQNRRSGQRILRIGIRDPVRSFAGQ